MKSEIKKELRYAFRSGRALVLFISFMSFALLTPIMLKAVLPQILGSQFADGASKDMAMMMDMTQVDCIQSYMGDVFEIGTIIIAFTLCGLAASEIRENTWVLPLCAGKRFGVMLGAKFIVFGVLLVMVFIISLLADYGYSGLLFGFEMGIIPIFYSGILQGIYMLFLLSCIIMWGVLIKKPISTGFLTMATAYGIHLISSLLLIQKWTPSGLLIESQKLTPVVSEQLLISLAVTVLLILLMTILSIWILRHMEWNVRSSQ